MRRVQEKVFSQLASSKVNDALLMKEKLGLAERETDDL
jgi:hypothetical protein